MEDLATEYPGEEWILKGTEKPDFIEKPWHAFYWQAWHSLRYDRPYAGMVGSELPIFWTSIDRYAAREGLLGDAFDRLVRFVSAIDFAYLDARRKETEKSTATKREE